MTVNAISMGAVATTVDLAAPATATFGTDARKSLNGERLLWMGNAHVDNKLSYTGAQNDRDPIINRIGTDPTISMPGYYTEDCNMDGVVRYTGSLNDRDPILVNLGGSIPTTIRLEQLP